MISVSFTYFEPVLSFRVHEFTESVVIEGIVFSGIAVGYGVMAMFVSCFSK